jgi:hypothetical protein
MKKLILALLMCLAFLNNFKAQDTIIKKNGEVILAKITKVTSANIFYTENKIGKSLSLSEIGYYTNLPRKAESEAEAKVGTKNTGPQNQGECDIEKKVDKFTGEITLSTKYTDWAQFYKFKREGIEFVVLSLFVDGYSSSYGEKGVIILFSDGTKIEKPNEKIDSKYLSNNVYRHSAWVTLNESDLEILKTKTMTDFRLYIYERKISENKAIKVLEKLNCLLNHPDF